MDWVPLNFGMLSHVSNWVTVTLMVLVAVIAMHVIRGKFQPDQEN
jgi:hypothetical protein